MPFAPFSRIPKAVWPILREMARHTLRHPVVGVLAAARDSQGQWLLVRRADTGTWALPGGTLEWGESLRSAVEREVREETGAIVVKQNHLVGVYSQPNRDPRFHAVTVVVDVTVDCGAMKAGNPIEVSDVRLFDVDDVPADLAMNMGDIFAKARDGGMGAWE